MTKFSEYVRATSFNLSLSKRQVETLLLIHKGGFGLFLQRRIDMNTSHGVVQLINLAQKGLLVKPDNSNWQITEEGTKVAELLILAGYHKEIADEQKAEKEAASVADV